jgi:hypothetical protein
MLVASQTAALEINVYEYIFTYCRIRKTGDHFHRCMASLGRLCFFQGYLRITF